MTTVVVSRPVGRPRLASPERIARKKASKKAWADRNYAYVRAQIRALGSRPEYLERRRMVLRERKRRLVDEEPSDAHSEHSERSSEHSSDDAALV